MLKIAHLGAYGKNIGDSIALANVRSHLEKELNMKVEWRAISINKFFSHKNDINYCVEKFSEINRENDVLIVGGGGLIEGSTYSEMKTGYKLPFCEQVLKVIDIPIICYGLGVNLFRGMPGLTQQGIDNLALLIHESAAFSVRDDGSYDLLMDMIPTHKIKEIPDPGVLMSWEKARIDKLETGCFQPAFNRNKKVNEARGMTNKNMKLIKKVIKQNNLTVMPHTHKDYVIQEANYVFDPQHFLVSMGLDQFDELVEAYKGFDYSIAMRGHGQLIAIGINVPSIYLSTQDKVSTFSKMHGFDEFNVDIEEEEWRDKLEWRLELLKDNPTAWYRIRDRYMECANAAYQGFNQSAAKLIQS